RRQHARYGEVNAETELGFGPGVRWLLPYTTDSAEQIESKLREDYLDFEDETPVTWAHLIREEVAEAFAEADLDRARAELIQVAALAVAAVEKIDRDQSL